MHVLPILSPSGDPVFVSGGDDAHFKGEYRGWTVSLEWVLLRRKVEACMVILPARNILMAATATKPGAWVILRKVMHEFVGFDRDGKCTGSASQDLIREAIASLPLLGKDSNDKQAALSLVDTVIHFADRLVQVPVAPIAVQQKLRGEALWDVTASDKSTGKTIKEASV